MFLTEFCKRRRLSIRLYFWSNVLSYKAFKSCITLCWLSATPLPAELLRYKKSNQLHAASRAQQDRQREHSVKIFRYGPPPPSLSADFGRHCALSSGTQHGASTPERSNGNINLNKYLISSSRDRTHNQSCLQLYFDPLFLFFRLRLFIIKHVLTLKQCQNEKKKITFYIYFYSIFLFFCWIEGLNDLNNTKTRKRLQHRNNTNFCFTWSQLKYLCLQ